MVRKVLILGANGLFGSHAARAFAAAGWEVSRYDRAAGNMSAAARGKDLLVNALNPPRYHNWQRMIPEITDQVLKAARSSGATVLIPGNVYVYGDQPGPWGAETAHRPVSRKGRIRAEMEAAYRAASQDGVRTIALRGGDYIAPGDPRTILAMVMLKSLANGKVTALGAPAAKRAYAYLPDMARAAAAIADRCDALSAYEDIPFPGLAFSALDLRDAFQSQLGLPLRVTRFPWWTLAVAGPVWELARELREMRYLFDTPHQLDGSRFAALLPEFRTTPLPEVIAAELAALTPG